MTLRDDLLAYLGEHHHRSLKGVLEARSVAPDAWDETAELFLSWGKAALGDAFLPLAVQAFVDFSNSVILEQGRYEQAGHYASSSFEACREAVYSSRVVMDHYLWGVYLTNFLWAHHMELSLFFRDRFLSRLPPSPSLLEIAPGHGGWGVWALHHLPDATLRGFDISPSSIFIASRISRAAGVGGRVTYEERNALDLDQLEGSCADAIICSFLIEHLETPARLFENIAHLLKPGAWGYLSGALTAAQVDHIYEFRRESELVTMAEEAGLRVVETMSTSPRRILPRARQLPRSMGMVFQRKTQEHW